MRTMTLAAGIIAVGTLAALPFRKSEAPIDPDAPLGIATGPLARQMHSDAMQSAEPWSSRPGFDSSLAWQPQPMTLDAAPPAFELPPMPDQYPLDVMEVPIPAVVQERFDATASRFQAAGPKELATPQIAEITDPFVHTPLLEPVEPARAPAKVQVASVIHNSSDPPPAASRQYIREPQ